MKLFWKFYCFLFLAITLSNLTELLDKNSPFGVYYNTTIVFNPWFILPYWLNIINAFIMGIVCAYTIGYAFNLKGFQKAPTWLLVIRLLSDATGHAYEIKMIQSAFYQNKWAGFIGLASLILPILPSYLAHWRMTYGFPRSVVLTDE